MRPYPHKVFKTVSQNLPFGEPLTPKTPTMQKIRATQNTLKNTPCPTAENVQNWLQNGVVFFSFWLVWASPKPCKASRSPWRLQKLQDQPKMTKNMKKMRHFFKLLGFNCGLPGQVHGHSRRCSRSTSRRICRPEQTHGHSHCTDGFVLVCTSAVKSTCCA